MYAFSVYQDLDELRQHRGGGGIVDAATIMGIDYPTDQDFSVYVWNNTSTSLESVPDIIVPVVGDDLSVGRWYKVDLDSSGITPPVNSDWAATDGLAMILNKPTLFSGVYSDLSGKPSLFSGAYVDLTGKPSLFSGSYNDLTSKPTIPAAQVNSDWNASSGVAQISNKPSLATVATSGSYLDLSNKPSTSITKPVRSLNSVFQISTTRQALVTYAVNVGVTSLLLVGTQGSVALEYADDSGFTSNVVTVLTGTNSTGGVLNVTNVGTVTLHGMIPAAKYVRIRTISVTGTPTFTMGEAQEVLW